MVKHSANLISLIVNISTYYQYLHILKQHTSINMIRKYDKYDDSVPQHKSQRIFNILVKKSSIQMAFLILYQSNKFAEK